MFDKTRENRRLQAALMQYEGELIQKNRLLRQDMDLLKQAEQMQQVLEECNDALARENARLANNEDTDADLVDELLAEFRVLSARERDRQALEDENYQLWIENKLLLQELIVRAPLRAYEISSRFGRKR